MSVLSEPMRIKVAQRIIRDVISYSVRPETRPTVRGEVDKVMWDPEALQFLQPCDFWSIRIFDLPAGWSVRVEQDCGMIECGYCNGGPYEGKRVLRIDPQPGTR